MRPYTVQGWGERIKVNERRTVVGGLIGHCVSPQPWREIDAHGPRLRVQLLQHVLMGVGA